MIGSGSFCFRVIGSFGCCGMVDYWILNSFGWLFFISKCGAQRIADSKNLSYRKNWRRRFLTRSGLSALCRSASELETSLTYRIDSSTGYIYYYKSRINFSPNLSAWMDFFHQRTCLWLEYVFFFFNASVEYIFSSTWLRNKFVVTFLSEDNAPRIEENICKHSKHVSCSVHNCTLLFQDCKQYFPLSTIALRKALD